MTVKKLLDSVVDDDDDGIFYKLDLLERDDLISTFIEVETLNEDDFLKVKESLTRCGVVNTKIKELLQIVHLLHKKGKYYLVSVKELLALDGQMVSMTDIDYMRRNNIANLLVKWGLVKLKNPDVMYQVVENRVIPIYVLSYRDKKDWTLVSKYKIGTIKTRNNNGNR
jgi:hypothetical protein